MSVGKLWLRQSTQTYYAKVDGKQVRLGPCLKRAEAARNALLVKHGTRNPSVSDIVTLYLDWYEANRSERGHAERVKSFASVLEMFGDKDAAALTPADLTRWIQAHFPKTGNTRKSDLLSMVSTAWNWAERNHGIASKIKRLDKPTCDMREFYLPRSRWDELLKHCSPSVRDLVEFMLFTGARPQEARAVERKHWHGNRFIFPPSQAKGKRQGRVIYVPDALHKMIERRIAETEDFVFKSTKGIPWNKTNFNNVSRRLKRKIGEPEFCMYACRHSFAADKISRGVDIAKVAKLLGHTSTDMVYKRYGHLAEQIDVLSDAINA